LPLSSLYNLFSAHLRHSVAQCYMQACLFQASVRNPRVSKGSFDYQALPDGRASDTNRKSSENDMKPNILRLAAAILFCTSVLAVIASVRAQKPPPGQNEIAVSLSILGIPLPSQTPSAPAAKQEKTLGETGKNIQVLKSLPESQLGTVMQYIATSMGRRCDFCHVNKGVSNW